MKKYFYLLLVALVCTSYSNAQVVPGGIINLYIEVTGIAVSSVTVVNAAGYNAGDRTLLIQMQGATINATNTAAFGTITNYNNSGNYEFITILSVSGNTVTFTHPLCRAYTVGQGVQLIRVPVYPSPAITGVITCQPWNGTTGGVAVFESPGTVTFGALGGIDVSGMGFRGGNFVNVRFFRCASMNWAAPTLISGPPNTSGGSWKGEGISQYITGMEGAKGRNANGGGGGMPGNSGGGGGSNISSAGLGGNEAFGYCPQANGGLGGQPLNYTAQDKIFPGGGGGGGYGDNSLVATSGANGGGIIIINAAGITGNNRSITANGASQTTIANDESAGGGGGAGVVMLNVPAFTGILNVNARGGNGGSTFNNSFTRSAHGTGGGGSGGAVVTSLPSLPFNVNTNLSGGLPGLILNPASPVFNTANGARPGNPGIEISRPLPANITVTANPRFICSGGSSVLTASAPGATLYSWEPSTGLSSTTGATVTASPLVTTTYTVTANGPGGCRFGFVTVFVSTPPPVITASSNANLCPGQTENLCATVPCTGLFPGDIAIVRYRESFSAANRNITITPLVRILPCHQVFVTTRAWNNTTNNFTSAANAFNNFQVPAATYNAGQILSLNNINPNSGQVFVYTVVGGQPRLIYGLSTNNWGFTGIAPGGLANGSTAVGFANSPFVTTRTWNFVTNNQPQTVFLSSFSNPANWATAFNPLIPLNVTGVAIPGFTWAGGGTPTGICAGPNSSGLSVTVPGTYTVTYTDIHGCASTASQTITQQGLQPQWATYFGGTGFDRVDDVEISPLSGNIIITGITNGLSANLPNPLIPANKRFIGPQGGNPLGITDVFIAEISSNGQQVNWINYIGGTSSEEPADLFIDNNGHIYLTFNSQSNDLPPVNPIPASSSPYCFRFNPSGITVWARNYGINSDVNGITVTPGAGGKVFLHGAATLDGLPNPINTHSGNGFFSSDFFVARIDKTTGNADWSAYYDYGLLTGSFPTPTSEDVAIHQAIAHDAAGDVYVAGQISIGFFGFNGQVMKVNGSTGAMMWIHRLNQGISGYNSLDVQGSDVVLTGLVNGTSIGPNIILDADIILSRRSTTTGAETSQRVITGNNTEFMYDIRANTDPQGNLYITGFTASSDLATVLSAINPAVSAYHNTHTSYIAPGFSGSQDMFIGRFTGNNFTPDWFTYYASASANQANWNNDVGNALAIDNAGSVYVVGNTQSLDFEFINALLSTYLGNTDGAIIKLSCNTTAPCPNCRMTGETTQKNENDFAEDIIETEISSGVSVYPNPFADEITISVNGYTGVNQTLEVTDLNGKVLIGKLDITGQIEVTFGKELSNGFYLVRITNEQETKTIRIAKTE